MRATPSPAAVPTSSTPAPAPAVAIDRASPRAQSRANGRTPSTTRFGTGGRISDVPPEALGKSRRRRPPKLSQWPQRKTLTIKVTYRGGAECWWQVEARGRVWRRPGTLALHDVLQDVYDGIGSTAD